jgi:quinol-cytochrome oxidoreductase complex cytochrome b subunit
VTLLTIALVALMISGAWLWFEYRPSAPASLVTIRTRSPGEQWVRQFHRWSAVAAVGFALSALVAMVAARVRVGARGVVAGIAMLLTTLGAVITGALLPWDQLALWAVTVGTDISGVRAVFENRVKYVLVDGHEVSPSTYRFWAITHVVLGVLVAVAVLLAWLRTREPARVTREADLVGAP